jgi:probable addiction module antidote protein
MGETPNRACDETAAALNDALAAGDLDRIMGALGEMTRAHRMRRVAQETGLGRESLYKSMRAGASPEFATVLKVLRSLGYRLQVTPIAEEDSQ